jgi:hypothetical protein
MVPYVLMVRFLSPGFLEFFAEVGRCVELSEISSIKVRGSG